MLHPVLQPGQIDGVPAWASSNPAVATVEPAQDGLSAVVKAADELGTTQISVTADATLKEFKMETARVRGTAAAAPLGKKISR